MDVMRQLVFLGPGRAEWQEATQPEVGGALEAIVEPVAVATCSRRAISLALRR